MVSFLVERDSLTLDRLFKVFVGDFLSIMLALCVLNIKGIARLVNLRSQNWGGTPPAAWQGPDIKNTRNPNSPKNTTALIAKLPSTPTKGAHQ